jgi:hypothetical protein
MMAQANLNTPYWASEVVEHCLLCRGVGEVNNLGERQASRCVVAAPGRPPARRRQGLVSGAPGAWPRPLRRYRGVAPGRARPG